MGDSFFALEPTQNEQVCFAFEYSAGYGESTKRQLLSKDSMQNKSREKMVEEEFLAQFLTSLGLCSDDNGSFYSAPCRSTAKA